MTPSDDTAPADSDTADDERSAAELFSDLAGETGILVRHELALLRHELARNLARAGRGVMALAVAAALGLGGVGALLAAAILALSRVAPPWLAALLVAAGCFLVGAVFFYFARRRLGIRALAPRRSLASLRADAVALRERMR